MASTGDSYTVELRETHLDWGNYRNTMTRNRIDGEGYIPIPLHEAMRINIYNSNFAGNRLGYNLFRCRSADGFFDDIVLKAAGNKERGDIYAKQFQGNGDLKALGKWYSYCSAKPGDVVKVTWESPADIVIELIK